jgi:hypothetical protein
MLQVTGQHHATHNDFTVQTCPLQLSTSNFLFRVFRVFRG